MALAVEKAAVVLVCMSQKYKDSPNCRTGTFLKYYILYFIIVHMFEIERSYRTVTYFINTLLYYPYHNFRTVISLKMFFIVLVCLTMKFKLYALKHSNSFIVLPEKATYRDYFRRRWRRRRCHRHPDFLVRSITLSL